MMTSGVRFEHARSGAGGEHYIPTMQIVNKTATHAMAGLTPGEPGTLGWPPYLIAGRQITRSHYEAVADIASGFNRPHPNRRSRYTIVGLTRRMAPLMAIQWYYSTKDAQEAQFKKDNDAI